MKPGKGDDSSRYECDDCGLKVKWTADGGPVKPKKDFGQQYVDDPERAQKILNAPNMPGNWHSSVLLMSRSFYCYACAKKRKLPLTDFT